VVLGSGTGASKRRKGAACGSASCTRAVGPDTRNTPGAPQTEIGRACRSSAASVGELLAGGAPWAEPDRSCFDLARVALTRPALDRTGLRVFVVIDQRCVVCRAQAPALPGLADRRPLLYWLSTVVRWLVKASGCWRAIISARSRLKNSCDLATVDRAVAFVRVS